MGAGRLANAALDRSGSRRDRGAAKRHPADRSVEDGGQSPPHPVGSGRVADARRRLDLPHRLPLVWTTFILATIAVPALLPAFAEAIPRRAGISKRTHIRAVGRSFTLAVSQMGLWITFMAHQAWLMGDAIGRTLIRVYLTHRRLLEWMTAAQAKSGLSRTLAGAYRRMGGAGPGCGRHAGCSLRPAQLADAAPFLLLWAPRRSSRDGSAAAERRPDAGVVGVGCGLLRSTARRTWRFFMTFVGPGERPAAGQLPGRPAPGCCAS